MGPIVCATRGGGASRRTQERAIALAKERDSDLVFLFVVDPSFTELVDEKLSAALTDELGRLGRSLLCIAQARAREKGTEAETEIRTGSVRQEIEKYLREVDADTLVIGAPRANSTGRAFGSENIYQLAEAIEQSTGVDVVVET